METAIFWIVVFVIGACCLVKRGKARRQRFEIAFPPISDDEFVALCTPGTDREIALKVRRIVSEQLGVEYARIHPSCHFINDLGAD